MASTELLGFGHYTSSARVEDFVAGYLGEFADDYNLDGLVAAYRAAVNTELADSGITLCGDDFYATYPAPDDAEDLINAAIEAPDLGELAAQFDRS